MEVQSQYTRSFISNDITRLKYNELMDLAVLIRGHKNKVSEFVNSNLNYFLDISKLSFIKEMREKYKGEIPSSFDVHLYTAVFTAFPSWKAVFFGLLFEADYLSIGVHRICGVSHTVK